MNAILHLKHKGKLWYMKVTVASQLHDAAVIQEGCNGCAVEIQVIAERYQ